MTVSVDKKGEAVSHKTNGEEPRSSLVRKSSMRKMGSWYLSKQERYARSNYRVLTAIRCFMNLSFKQLILTHQAKFQFQEQ